MKPKCRRCGREGGWRPGDAAVFYTDWAGSSPVPPTSRDRDVTAHTWLLPSSERVRLPPVPRSDHSGLVLWQNDGL